MTAGPTLPLSFSSLNRLLKSSQKKNLLVWPSSTPKAANSGLKTNLILYHLKRATETGDLYYPDKQLSQLVQQRTPYRDRRRWLQHVSSGVASPKIKSRYANFKLLSLFIYLEIDCFHSQ